MKKFLTALMLAGMLVSVGCAHAPKATIIQAIDTKDIFIVPSGASVHIPAGTHAEWVDDKGNKTVKDWPTDTDITVSKNGRFISDFLLTDIVNTDQ